jgi:hypothetical protein
MKITKKIFDSEIAMCRKLNKKSKGCQWGKCKDCGAVPLLYKLHSGLLVDNKKDIAKLKKVFLN